MGVAYILEQGASVGREGERLVVKKGSAVLHSLHIFKLEQLVLFGQVAMTPAAVSYVLQHGVDTVFMTRSGRYRGRLQPLHGKNITLRCEQFQKMTDESFCTRSSRAIILGKLANMRTNLMRLNRAREELELEDQVLGLKRLMEKAVEADSIDSLRGYEGRGAAVYFDGFSKGFLAEGIEFRKRVRRPPTDPVNALLSLGYTLLFNSVMAAVSLVGFDPYLGCLHTVEYGRPSLALDLMEEWRPVIVDSLVLSVFNLKTITGEDFIRSRVEEAEDDEDPLNEEPTPAQAAEADGPRPLPVKLTDAGFRKFIAQFERKMGEKVRFHLTGQQFSYRDCIREQVRHFARHVRGEDKEYQPMLVR
jgi:CRISPR-associated protein Cas1